MLAADEVEFHRGSVRVVEEQLPVVDGGWNAAQAIAHTHRLQGGEGGWETFGAKRHVVQHATARFGHTRAFQNMQYRAPFQIHPQARDANGRPGSHGEPEGFVERLRHGKPVRDDGEVVGAQRWHEVPGRQQQALSMLPAVRRQPLVIAGTGKSARGRRYHGRVCRFLF